LKRVLFPQLGCPIKITTGASGAFIDGLDIDFLGDAPADGHGRASLDIFDQNRPSENCPTGERDGIARVKSQGEKPAPNAFAAADIDNAHRPAGIGLQ